MILHIQYREVHLTVRYQSCQDMQLKLKVSRILELRLRGPTFAATLPGDPTARDLTAAWTADISSSAWDPAHLQAQSFQSLYKVCYSVVLALNADTDTSTPSQLLNLVQ